METYFWESAFGSTGYGQFESDEEALNAWRGNIPDLSLIWKGDNKGVYDVFEQRVETKNKIKEFIKKNRLAAETVAYLAEDFIIETDQSERFLRFLKSVIGEEK